MPPRLFAVASFYAWSPPDDDDAAFFVHGHLSDLECINRVGSACRRTTDMALICEKSSPSAYLFFFLHATLYFVLTIGLISEEFACGVEAGKWVWVKISWLNSNNGETCWGRKFKLIPAGRKYDARVGSWVNFGPGGSKIKISRRFLLLYKENRADGSAKNIELRLNRPYPQNGAFFTHENRKSWSYKPKKPIKKEKICRNCQLKSKNLFCNQ